MGCLKALVCMVKGHVPSECFETEAHRIILKDESNLEKIEELLKEAHGRFLLRAVYCTRCHFLIEPAKRPDQDDDEIF